MTRRAILPSAAWVPKVWREERYLVITVWCGLEDHVDGVCGERVHHRNASYLDPHAFIEILRIANATGNAAAQSSAMNQNARGPNAP